MNYPSTRQPTVSGWYFVEVAHYTGPWDFDRWHIVAIRGQSFDEGETWTWTADGKPINDKTTYYGPIPLPTR